MFRSIFRHPVSVLGTVAKDPLDAFAALRDGVFARLEPGNNTRYQPDPDWEAKLQRLLGIGGGHADEFWPVWHAGVASLRARGFRVGPSASTVGTTATPVWSEPSGVWCATCAPVLW